jgi:hypothetical protein
LSDGFSIAYMDREAILSRMARLSSTTVSKAVEGAMLACRLSTEMEVDVELEDTAGVAVS